MIDFEKNGHHVFMIYNKICLYKYFRALKLNKFEL